MSFIVRAALAVRIGGAYRRDGTPRGRKPLRPPTPAAARGARRAAGGWQYFLDRAGLSVMSTRITSSAALAAAALLHCGSVNADPRPTVIELFTSEGCNSCPPAEAYIGELARRPGVLALSYHVDYWDGLGWRDRFALRESVVRQNTYAQALGRTGVYTPQVILDGREDYVGSDRARIERALADTPGGARVGLAASARDIQVSLDGPAQVVPSDVLLVAYLREATSAIGRGENAGRTLHEYNIVRGVHRLGRWDGKPASFQVARSTLPPDATNVAVLVQAPGQTRIIGAASRALD